MPEVIVGIDLGTTNSEIAAFVDGKPQVLGNGSQLMLPSCVALSPSGDLLIGQAARNQSLLYPERTIKSVKRLMGTNQKVTLGDKTFTPPEISALILRELARWASARLGETVRKAVITVPAYFSDAQRTATREAGELAGLEVVRIVNEPTAASLAYGLDAVESGRTVMIYDLGGGTLDVSIVRIEGEVTEVLASHGNNQLGGDDFDQKLVDHLLETFRQRHNIDLRDKNPAAYARLWWAAEAAKKQLSYEPYARVLEESLIQVDGRPLHLDVEISREKYEEMIRPLLDQTLDSASKALSDAGLLPQAVDAVLLVGGSTRTPLVLKLLEQMCGKAPRTDLHPDLCVALGAGVLASRLGGHDVQRVLVDVSPYSFGISYLGERDGRPYPHCYHPVIRRNTPLPVTRTEEYQTAADYQTEVHLDVYQGDNSDALRNVHVGHFEIDGLQPIGGPNVVLCRMRLDVDGILHVTAIEKKTGLSKHVAITGATLQRNSTELARGRDQLDRLFANRVTEDPEEVIDGAATAESAEVDEFGSLSGPAATGTGPGVSTQTTNETATAPANAEVSASAVADDPRALVARCREKIPAMHADDQEEAIGFIEDVESALAADDSSAVAAATKMLSEFLFFVEGR
ncbi:MAG TPA: Hsp70 family protein [Tepidisphaeraceae bacterium]|jgi:molecular chaperone DnaK (HSP70)|nr:Hsp70 family protein [Tepidisphaeraceae bacterium]